MRTLHSAAWVRSLTVAAAAGLGLACARPTSPGTGTEAPAPPTISAACDRLAQRLSQELTLDGEALGAVLVEHELSAAQCETAQQQAETLGREPPLPPEQMPLAYARLLVDTLQQSPKATRERLEELERLAVLRSLPPPPLAELSPAERARLLDCPAPSQPRSAAEPEGRTTTWCERDDGVMHGPRTLWSITGVPLRVRHELDGRTVDVDYPRLLAGSEEQQLAWLQPSMFGCADGLDARSTTIEGVHERWCEDAQGRRQGSAVQWGPSTLVLRHARYHDGEVQSARVSNVDASPEVAEVLARLWQAYALASEDAELDGIRRELRDVLAAHPRHPEALALWAEVSFSLGAHPPAQTVAERCVRALPSMAPCWFTLGVLAQLRDDPAAARESLLRYLALDPGGRYANDAFRALERLDP